MRKLHFILALGILLAACSPRVDLGATQTVQLATLVQANILGLQAAAQGAETQTAEAVPTLPPTSIDTPTEAPTSTPQPTATPRPQPTATVYIPPPPTATFFTAPLPTATSQPSGNCDPAYPTVCIPPPPPDLDCADIPHRRFQVNPPDPHRFDGDNDGIGCES